MILKLVIPLLATIVIELGVLLFLRERRRRVLWGSVGLNILTNVPLNLYAVYVGAGLTMAGVGEMFVMLVEALGYWWLMRTVFSATPSVSCSENGSCWCFCYRCRLVWNDCHSESSGSGASTAICSFDTGCVNSTCRDISEMLPSGLLRGAPYFRSPLIGQPIAANWQRIWW